MIRKAKEVVPESRSFMSARRRALERLRKGMDLRWVPAASRDELHRRGRDATSRR
jgi:hypothetical protein